MSADSRKPRNPAGRRAAIRRRLVLDGAVAVEALAREMGVSVATVRRDLSVLEMEGVARRTHGGALITTLRGADQAFALREQVDPDAKRAIARRAVALVRSGQTLLLNDGSTILAVARELVAAHLTVTVATPGVNIATCLSESKSISTYLLGGLVRHRSVGTSGPFAEQMLSSINADLALIASDSFSVREGLAFAYEADARLARLMHEQAATTVILASARKLGQRDRFTAFRAEEVDMLLTDCDRFAVVEPFGRVGVEVVSCPLAGEDASRAERGRDRQVSHGGRSTPADKC